MIPLEPDNEEQKIVLQGGSILTQNATMTTTPLSFRDEVAQVFRKVLEFLHFKNDVMHLFDVENTPTQNGRDSRRINNTVHVASQNTLAVHEVNTDIWQSSIASSDVD
eukprot:INCI16058.2.p1 GENE.INCI16058.2~~INCI16058.2.p1  ORF type:complete len:108 (-),score=13.39 INCI16058.2:19-342(-)